VMFLRSSVAPKEIPMLEQERSVKWKRRRREEGVGAESTRSSAQDPLNFEGNHSGAPYTTASNTWCSVPASVSVARVANKTVRYFIRFGQVERRSAGDFPTVRCNIVSGSALCEKESDGEDTGAREPIGELRDDDPPVETWESR